MKLICKSFKTISVCVLSLLALVGAALGDDHNIADKQHEVTLVPSSQSRDPKLFVENIVDGDSETSWASYPDTYPNWIEFRYIQPVRVNGFVVREVPGNGSRAYALEVRRAGRWEEIVRVDDRTPVAGEAISHTFDSIISSEFRYVMRQGESNVCAISEFLLLGDAGAPAPQGAGWESHYIWHPELTSNCMRYFRKSFRVDSDRTIRKAWLQAACDDRYRAFLNGKEVGLGGSGTGNYEVSTAIQPGENVLAVRGENGYGYAGLIAELLIEYEDGSLQRVITDRTWKTFETDCSGWKNVGFDDAAWVASDEHGIPPYSRAYQTQTYFDNLEQEPFTVSACLTNSKDIRPGSTATITVSLSLTNRTTHDFGFILELGEIAHSEFDDFLLTRKSVWPELPTSQWEPGRTYTLTNTIFIPEYAPHGPVSIFMHPRSAGSNGQIADADQDQIGIIKIHRLASEPVLTDTLPTASVEVGPDRVPRFRINGELVPPLMAVGSSTRSYRSCWVDSELHAPVWRLWIRDQDLLYPVKDEEAAFAKYGAIIDQEIEAALRYDPNLYFIMGSILRYSPEWLKQHPEAAIVMSDGTPFLHSFSSEAWRRDSRRAIERVTEHLIHSKYRSRIIGLWFGFGNGPETMYWGTGKNPYDTTRDAAVFGDFNKDHLVGFKTWLRAQYGDTPLGTVFAQPALNTMDFTSDEFRELLIATIRTQDHGFFKNPETSRLAIDYWTYHSDVVADCGKEFARVIKAGSDGKLLTGFFGLYTAFTYLNPADMQYYGQQSLSKALASPDIDMIADLQSYINVRAGSPVTLNNVSDSIRLHGKMAVVEYDARTFLVDLNKFNYGTYSLGETLSVMARNYGYAAVKQVALWNNSFPASGLVGRPSVPWYDNDVLLRSMGDLGRIYQYAMSETPNADLSTSEIAVIIGNADIPALDLMQGHKVWANAMTQFIHFELPLTGVSYDLFQLSDVASPALDRYRVYLFLGGYRLTAAQRERINALTRRQGKTALFFYAPGYVDDDSGLSLDNIRDLTGMHIEESKLSTVPTLAISTNNAVFTGTYGSERPRQYLYDKGPITNFVPRFAIQDDSVQRLGNYTDDGSCGLAIKEQDGWKVVYGGIPRLGAKALRDLFAYSGVHIYSRDRLQVVANRKYLMVHTINDAVRSRIELPEKSSVYDLLKKKIIVQDEASFPIDLPARSTGLYYVGTTNDIVRLKAHLRVGQ